MIIDLDKLSDSAEQIYGEEIVNIHDVSDVDRQVKCRIDLSARKNGETFYFHAKVLGILSTQCHKCLQPTDFSVDTTFDVVVQRGGTEKVGKESSCEEDYILIPIGEQQFSLDQHIYENLVINIPMRIVCSEACKGLCSTCGANLNENPCSCESEIDPQWGALKALKDKLRRS